MGLKKGMTAFVLVFCLACAAFAQTPSGYLEEGKKSFAKGDYATALVQLRSAVMVPGAENLSESYYWLILTEIALAKYGDAAKHIDDFLSQFPKDKRTADILYQKGRVLFLGSDYDGAIQVFQSLVEGYPSHDLTPFALYWSGECLFQLGQLEYAQKIFGLYLEKYPKGAKLEAATYRLSLISYKFREEELLKLLKWSHEEYLKTVEEFQRREKAYEQAIESYQKRIADLMKESRIAEVEKSSAEYAAKAAGLESSLAEAGKSLADKDKRIAELLASIAALESQIELAKASPAEKDKKITDLLATIASLQKDLDAAKASLATAEAATKAALAAEAAAKEAAAKAVPATSAATPAASPAATTGPSEEDLARVAKLDAREKLLALKEEALSLKEYYLDWLAAKGTAGK